VVRRNASATGSGERGLREKGDPNHDETIREFARTPEERYRSGTDEECRRWIAEAEATLATNPTDHEARIQRLYRRVGLERRARRDQLAERYPELATSEAFAPRDPSEASRPASNLDDPC